jgi:hypothetical protein
VAADTSNWLLLIVCNQTACPGRVLTALVMRQDPLLIFALTVSPIVATMEPFAWRPISPVSRIICMQKVVCTRVLSLVVRALRAV